MSFTFVKGSASRADNPFFSVSDLEEHCTQPYDAGICVQFEWMCEINKSQDGCCS